MIKKIVVVDDSRTARQQVGAALAEAGYAVIEGVDGLDGIAKVTSNLDASLIICDVNMPNMGGLEMIEALRRDHPDLAVPIVMLTTEGQLELVQRAKQSGARGWIVKPFKPHMLLSAVRKLVGDA
ncbi:MAG: response regulator [Myxococcaceae bacterium]|nr:response regulator [Myxococcaceae bacterium]